MIPEHPAALPKDRGLWFGPEVEGAYASQRPHTAFISRELTAEELARLTRERHFVEAVFLTETFEAWAWFERTLLYQYAHTARFVCGRYPHQLPAFLALPYAKTIALMVRILDAPWVKLLRAGDEISVGVPYDLWTYRLEDGVQTQPKDYLGDTE